MNYYVYYRVAPEHAAQARSAVATMMRALEERTGIAGRLMRRDGEPLLWMEVYETVGDTPRFEAALEQLFESSDFAALLAPGSVRKTERFVAQRHS